MGYFGVPQSAPAAAPGAAGDMLATQRVVNGFTSGDYLEYVGASALRGNNVTGFESIVAVLQPAYKNFTAGFIAGAGNLSTNEGYGLIIESTQPNPYVGSGAPARENLAFFDFWQDFQNYRIHILSCGTDLTRIRGTLQGRQNLSIATAGFNPTGIDFRIGRTGFSSPNAYGGVVLAFGMKTTGLFTDEELRDNILALLTTGGFDTSICHHAYRAAALELGAMAATWEDEGATGGLDLSLVGSLTVEDWPTEGVVEQISQDFSIVVTRNSATNQLTPGSQNVSVVGPTDIEQPEVLCDTTTNAPTVTLPAFPVNGGIFRVYDVGQNAGTNNITIARNGNTINGAAADLVLNVNGAMAHLIYDSVVGDWFAKVT